MERSISRLKARAAAGLALPIVLGVSLLSGGCHGSEPLNPQEAEGKHLYAVRCAHCHEDNDLGLKKTPPNLRGIFARNALPSGVAASDAAVERVVLTGKGLMPGFDGRFTRDQMGALVAYLHTGLR